MKTINLFATLNEERQQRRLAICEACEHKIQITNMCGKCGCFLPWKTKLAVANCPELKWDNELFEDTTE